MRNFLREFKSALLTVLFYSLIVAVFSSTIFFSCFAYAVQAQQDGWSLNLKDADIHAFIEQVSSITGTNFVVDPQVKGKVTVISSTPMDKEAVSELFLSVLRVNGFAAVQSGAVTRIVPLTNAKNAGISSDASSPYGEQIITRVLDVRNSSIDDAVKMLKPLVSQNGYIEGSTSSNAVIVSDYADNVSEIARMLQSLDKDDTSDIEVIPLKEESVANIVPLLENLLPAQIADKKAHSHLKVVANERRNSIIVKGDSKERRKVRHLIEMLDQKASDSSDIQVISLKHADAREMATLLRGMFFSDKKNNGPQQAFQGATNPSAAPPLAATAQGAGYTSTNAAAAATLAGLFPSSTDSASGGPSQAGDQQENLAQSFIEPNIALNALVIRADPTIMSKIRSLIAQMDIRRPQVLIEAAIFEINSTQAEQLGVQYAAGDVARAINSGTTQFSANQTGIGTLLTQLGSANAAIIADGGAIALGSNRFDVIIQALASTSGANLLSTPSITTMDNTEARIVVGQNVPFRTGSYSTLNAGVAAPFTTIDREDIGITLRVLPQIHEGNFVRLTIAQEVSSIAPTTADTAGAADIITNKRTIETKVLAEDGETVVLGGLIEDDKMSTVSKVPLLGDIPLLGALFRSTSTSLTKSNLVVFLRPTILHNRDDMGNVTQDRYGRIYDLQLGDRKTIRDVNENYTVAKPDNLFNPTPQPLPWLTPKNQDLPWKKLPVPQSLSSPVDNPAYPQSR